MGKGVDVVRTGLLGAAPGRVKLVALAIFTLSIGFVTILSHIAPANAIGEGVFSLDKSEYFVREGESLPVQVVRANGGTLVQDITVQVGIIDGTPGYDYPNATITQIVTFKAGTNPTSMPVDPADGGFVTINHNRAAETDIHIQIQSVNGNGAIGIPQTALVHILGRGTPTVTGLFPRSGAPAASTSR